MGPFFRDSMECAILDFSKFQIFIRYINPKKSLETKSRNNKAVTFSFLKFDPLS